MVFGAVSTVYGTSFLDAAMNIFLCDNDITSLIRLGRFSVIADSCKSKTAVTWADQELPKKEEVSVEEQMSRIEFRASQFPKDRNSRLTKEELMRKWRIGSKTTEFTLRHTRQQGTRHASFPLSRQYPTSGTDHNRYSTLSGQCVVCRTRTVNVYI
mmetsp:Transcript_15670/g.24381  ORF Transcript_15670/g.24381 Transcript_15670/m.24381 type:complete len:156 (-) Transcript_15670:302-769(-)